MEVVVGIILVLTLIYEPGNVEINNYCKYAVEQEEFDSRVECWNTYHEFRDDIPIIDAEFDL